MASAAGTIDDDEEVDPHTITADDPTLVGGALSLTAFMLRYPPEEIESLCKTARAFAEKCRDPGFRRLYLQKWPRGYQMDIKFPLGILAGEGASELSEDKQTTFTAWAADGNKPTKGYFRSSYSRIGVNRDDPGLMINFYDQCIDFLRLCSANNMPWYTYTARELGEVRGFGMAPKTDRTRLTDPDDDVLHSPVRFNVGALGDNASVVTVTMDLGDTPTLKKASKTNDDGSVTPVFKQVRNKDMRMYSTFRFKFHFVVKQSQQEVHDAVFVNTPGKTPMPRPWTALPRISDIERELGGSLDAALVWIPAGTENMHYEEGVRLKNERPRDPDDHLDPTISPERTDFYRTEVSWGVLPAKYGRPRYTPWPKWYEDAPHVDVTAQVIGVSSLVKRLVSDVGEAMAEQLAGPREQKRQREASARLLEMYRGDVAAAANKMVAFFEEE